MSGDRVLALVTDAFGGYGGIAQYNRDFIAALANCEEVQEVLVLPRLAPDYAEALPPNVRQVPPRLNRFTYALASTWQALCFRPSIVFCGHLYHGRLAWLVAWLVGAKLVSQVHGTEIWGELSSKHRNALEAADFVLTVSRDTRRKVLTKTSLMPSSVIVINNTVAEDFIPGDRAAARSTFGLGDEFAILTVARLDAREGYKGHDAIIPLLASLSTPGRPVVYLVAGVGDDRPRLDVLTQRCGVASQVRFLGKVPRHELPDLYRAADLFALPSTGEGFGIAFLEAMACGTPALGLAVGGAPDALGDGELGWCVAGHELTEALADAVSMTGNDPAKLSRAVHTRFGVKVYGQSVQRLFARIRTVN